MLNSTSPKKNGVNGAMVEYYSPRPPFLAIDDIAHVFVGPIALPGRWEPTRILVTL